MAISRRMKGWLWMGGVWFAVANVVGLFVAGATQVHGHWTSWQLYVGFLIGIMSVYFLFLGVVKAVEIWWPEEADKDVH